MALPYLIPVLLILSLSPACVLTISVRFSLTPSNNDSDVLADLDTHFVDLSCPSSHLFWFVPFNSMSIQGTTENIIRISLKNETLRIQQRGLYTCCPRQRVNAPTSKIQRVQTPSCCPCCSWPESEYCSPRLWNISPLLSSPLCLQTFLFTGVAPCPVESTLELPWRSKVLIPSPAPGPTSNLLVYSQIPNLKWSKRLWFASNSSGNSSDFSPRWGVCTTEERVPRYHLQLWWKYPNNPKCKIRPELPLAPPLMLPNVTCKTLPMDYEFTMNATTTLQLRVPAKRDLSVQCTASYTNYHIAHRHPTLCFRWRTRFDMRFSLWSRHKCIRSELMEDLETGAATDTLNFTSKNHPMVVEVEIVERNRATDVQNFSMLFLGTATPFANFMTVEVVHPVNSGGYNLISDRSNQSMTLLIFDVPLEHVTLGFYSLDEITSSASCTSQIGNLTLRRGIDKWLCKIPLPSIPFNVSLRQGNLETLVTVYPSPSTLLPSSTVQGLRGSVDVPINVTCGLVEGKMSPSLFNTTPETVNWMIYRGDDLVNETLTTTSWFVISPLINSSAVSVEPVLVWSSAVSSLLELRGNISTTKLPPVVDFSRKLCVVCETFFSLGGSTRSSKECVTLEAKEDPPEGNISAFDTALLRYSTIFAPIQVSNLSTPSFRIATAFPSGGLEINGSLPILSIYNGSFLELRCSVGRTRGSTSWPMIYSQSYLGDTSVPLGDLHLYALPFTLESRLRVNTSMITTIDEGKYVCAISETEQSSLLVRITDSAHPVIVEPNQPVRYFTANETIRLTCRASGAPGPAVLWRLINTTEAVNWTILKFCNDSYLRQENSCSLLYVPPANSKNITIECEAVNYLGLAAYTLNMIRISTSRDILTQIWKDYLFWIIVPLVLLVSFFICLVACLWRKGRQMSKAEKLVKMDNLIYGQPDKLANGCVGVDVYGLMPAVELRDRWCIDRRNLRPFSQPLGNGHYGTVQKAIYFDPRCKDKKHPDAFFVALKSPSNEIASLSCFRNEILHLMKLSHGPNIVKMIGCAFGEKGDLGDTLLVLEFCPNTSLSDFIHRMLYPRGCYDNRPMYIRNFDGVISTASTQISSTPNPSSESSVSQFTWDVQNMSVRILLSDSNPTGVADGERKRRRSTANRNNTSLVYQRLTRNSSSIFLQIATGISRGLEFLAENNVIHRDLATRNILLDARFNPKICDFGLAVTVESDGTCQHQATSGGCYRVVTFSKQLPFRILPPEALSKQLFYLSSDIWEFGLLLWQMFFFETRKPFESVQSSEALLRLLSSESCSSNGYLNYIALGTPRNQNQVPPTIDRPPTIPENVWAVICDCLRFQASDRPSAAEVRQRLDDCYTSYSEIEDECVCASELGGNCSSSLDSRLPSQENLNREAFILPNALEEHATPRLAVYENIEQVRNSAGYLESFPSAL